MNGCDDDHCRLHDVFLLNADEHYGSVTPGGDPAEAVATGGRHSNLYGTMLIHREQDLYVAPSEGAKPLQEMIRKRLLALRFSADDADEWAFRDWRRLLRPDRFHGRDDLRLSDQVVQAALEYRDTGMPIDEAVAWTVRSVSAGLAVYNRRRGWNPHTYSTLVSLCMGKARQSPSGYRAAEDDWVDAPIPAWRALRYLKAGLTVAESIEQEGRHRAGEDVDAAIDTLLGLTAGPPTHCGRGRVARLDGSRAI